MIIDHLNALTEIKKAKSEAKKHASLEGYSPTGAVSCGQFIEFAYPVPITSSKDAFYQSVSFYQFYDFRTKEFISTGELFRRVKKVPAYRRTKINVGLKKWMKE